jgi:hypothetical protein
MKNTFGMSAHSEEYTCPALIKASTQIVWKVILIGVCNSTVKHLTVHINTYHFNIFILKCNALIKSLDP